MTGANEGAKAAFTRAMKLADMKFARIEIKPPDGDIFNQDYDKWIFKIDQSITPKWWTKVDEQRPGAFTPQGIIDKVSSKATGIRTC